MKNIIPLGAIVASAIGLSAVTYNIATKPLETVDVVEKVKDGTVLIANQLDATNGGIGAGFIVGENVFVTNMHVVRGDGKVTIYSPDKNIKYDAEVIHKDPVADLAILKVKDWEKFKAETTPVDLPIGDSEEMKPGSKVIVVGHPWGLSWSVSEGIVSAKNRRPSQNPKFVDQVDAHLYQGNSGGPIFNQRGEVVCVSNMMLKGEGGSYGFCIPSVLLKKVLHDFNTLGRVQWRALNVSLDLTSKEGSVTIKEVEPEGAAAKAGILAGDTILETVRNGEMKKINSFDELLTELSSMYGDETRIDLLVERNGEKKMITVETSYKLSDDFQTDLSK